MTPEEIAKFAKAFPTGKTKPSEVAQQLKIAMEGAQGIRVNEVCFVATDSRLKDATSVAAQLAAASIGDDKDQFRQLLNDPQKLLELIAAGLILSGGIAVLRVSPGGPAVWAAATVSTAVILCWPRLHPLVLFAAGGALFGLADAIGLW